MHNGQTNHTKEREEFPRPSESILRSYDQPYDRNRNNVITYLVLFMNAGKTMLG